MKFKTAILAALSGGKRSSDKSGSRRLGLEDENNSPLQPKRLLTPGLGPPGSSRKGQAFADVTASGTVRPPWGWGPHGMPRHLPAAADSPAVREGRWAVLGCVPPLLFRGDFKLLPAAAGAQLWRRLAAKGVPPAAGGQPGTVQPVWPCYAALAPGLHASAHARTPDLALRPPAAAGRRRCCQRRRRRCAHRRFRQHPRRAARAAPQRPGEHPGRRRGGAAGGQQRGAGGLPPRAPHILIRLCGGGCHQPGNYIHRCGPTCRHACPHACLLCCPALLPRCAAGRSWGRESLAAAASSTLWHACALSCSDGQAHRRQLPSGLQRLHMCATQPACLLAVAGRDGMLCCWACASAAGCWGCFW